MNTELGAKHAASQHFAFSQISMESWRRNPDEAFRLPSKEARFVWPCRKSGPIKPAVTSV
jgi:hypothetical protein